MPQAMTEIRTDDQASFEMEVQYHDIGSTRTRTRYRRWDEGYLGCDEAGNPIFGSWTSWEPLDTTYEA